MTEPQKKDGSPQQVVDDVKVEADNDTSKFAQALVEKKAQRDMQEEQAKKGSFKFMMGYAKRQCSSLALGSFFLAGSIMADLAMPIFIGHVIDLMEKEDYDGVSDACLYMIIITIVSGLSTGMRSAIFCIMSERISRNLRKDYFDQILSKDITFFDERRTGELISRLNSDVQVVQDVLGTNFSMFVRSGLFIILTIIILCFISPTLTGVTCAGIIPIICLTIFYTNWMRILQRKIQDAKAGMNSVAEESFSNIRTVKAFNNEEDEMKKFEKGNQVVYGAGRRKTIYTGINSMLQQMFLYGAMAAVIYTGALLFQDDEISIGKVSSFLFYMIMMTFNFWIISMVLGNLASVLGAADKLVATMLYVPDVNSSGGDKIEGETRGTLEFRNVKFRYPSKPDVQVLKSVSFSVDNENNRVVALCGTSGCGKSSIVSLIQRFYDPEEGEILFNGRNIKELDPKWYHNQIAIVQQEPVLFSGTIRENITYGLELDDCNDEEVEELMDDACRQANAHEFIHDKDLFPLAYETIVGERGVKLSGGQKQRVAIARALIRKPKLLLLDEATSALDAESEHQVQQALDKLISAGKQTVVVVAHRLSTIKDANEIIVMQHGEIQERGTNQELLTMNGVYKNLVNRQLVTEEIDKENTEN